MLKKLVFALFAMLVGLSSLSSLSFADTPTNLIANPSMETSSNGTTPDLWQTGSWGTNNAAFSYTASTGHTGTHSATTTITSYTSGDAKWYFAPVTVQPNTSYTFSDYYESSVATDVTVQSDDGTGTLSYQDLGAVAASGTWQQAAFTFTTSASTHLLTVFHLISSIGSLSIDDASLTATATVAPMPPVVGNMVSNPSAETPDPSNALLPADWSEDSWGSNTHSFSYSTDAHTGSRSLSVNISSYDETDPNAGDAKWVFTPQNVTADTQYTFSDYYKATAATEVDAAFTMSDGTTLYQIIGLPEPETNWTQFSTTFTIPTGAQNVTIYHLIHSVGTLTLDDAYMAPYTPIGFNRALVSLTFDDGYDNEYTQGLPLLQKYGFDSTQFIITQDVNQAGYLTTAQVQALDAAGQEIASHTVTHNDLLTETAGNTTTPGTYDYEIAQSQATLEQWLGGKPVTDLAYPNGLYNAGIMSETEQYYSAARGVEDGLNSKDNFNPYDIKVQNVYDTTTTAQVADWVKQAQATNTWLVIVYHSVDPTGSNGSIYNVTPTQLDAQLSAIKTSGVAVETMAQAFAEVESQLGTTTPPSPPATIPGDVNGDGTVDALDLSTLLSNWGKTGATAAQGDLNGDGTVDALDLSTLLTNWSHKV